MLLNRLFIVAVSSWGGSMEEEEQEASFPFSFFLAHPGSRNGIIHPRVQCSSGMIPKELKIKCKSSPDHVF